MLTVNFSRLLTQPFIAGLLVLLSGCQENQDDAATAQIDAAQLSETVRILASDEFYGRAPGGPGKH